MFLVQQLIYHSIFEIFSIMHSIVGLAPNYRTFDIKSKVNILIEQEILDELEARSRFLNGTGRLGENIIQ